MKRAHRRTTLALLAGLASLPLLASPVRSAVDDDLFLFTSNYPPNVVLLQDNSRSMNHIEWHKAFDPTATPTCAFFDNDVDYIVDAGGAGSGLVLLASLAGLGPFPVVVPPECRASRTVYDPAEAPNDTYYSGRYLNWLFSAEADAFQTDIATAMHVPPACNQPACDECDEKYRRTRAQMAKQVLLDTLCIAEVKGVRFGQAFFRDMENVAVDDPNGGYVAVEVDDPTPPHASDLEAGIKNIKSSTETPLGESLFQIYTYFMSRTAADLPNGLDGNPFPAYSYKISTGDYTVSAAQIPQDPVESACQKNFVVIVTDGDPSRDDFDEEVTLNEAIGFTAFPGLVGDYHQPVGDEVEVPGDANESGWYLDDLAKFMHDKDFRPADFDGDQTLDVYTIGLATNSSTDDYLKKVADVSNGLFFSAKNGEELSQALLNALNDIIEKSQSFTAATVPSSRTADGGDFYTSFFLPSGKQAFWEGHLRSWHITASGDIEDKDGDCALFDPDAGECNSGPFDPDAEPFWDAGEEVPTAALRTLYVSKNGARASFDKTLTAADLGIQPFTTPGSPPDPSPNSVLYSFAGSTAINEEGLADEIVWYTRGCGFGTGVDTVPEDANVDTPQACVDRFWRLGDIFHSNPVVVGRPRASLSDPTYQTFKTTYGTRKRRIYAGANDGFVHAFDAGDWDVAAGEYDEGSGVEVFGFMPWRARQTIKNQVIDDPAARTYYVDGSPQVGDVWFYPTPGAQDADKTAGQWRTLLVGGLRQGGRHYYALDVTDPSGLTLTYPGYAWEFPTEADTDDPADPSSRLPWLGETWGQPVITRVKLDYQGTTVERWVVVVTGGYSATGDPNNPLYDPADTTQLAGRSIFILDAQTGEIIAEKKYSAAALDEQQNMVYAIAATPSVFDLDFDGYADVIYVGDLGGQVWKWAISDVGSDEVNDPGVDPDQSAWEFGRYFVSPKTTISGTDYYRSFFGQIAGALVGGNVYLAFGSGERADLGFEGEASSTNENNRLYVMIDPDPEELVAGFETITDKPDDPDSLNPYLKDATGLTTVAITNRGYYVRLEDGEKVVTRTDIFAGLVIAASFTPVPSLDPCTARGEGTLYVFDLKTGKGYFTDGSGNPARDLDIGAGLPTDPQVSLGPGGTDNRVYIEMSDGGLVSPDPLPDTGGGSLLYWRELP